MPLFFLCCILIQYLLYCWTSHLASWEKVIFQWAEAAESWSAWELVLSSGCAHPPLADHHLPVCYLGFQQGYVPSLLTLDAQLFLCFSPRSQQMYHSHIISQRAQDWTRWYWVFLYSCVSSVVLVQVAVWRLRSGLPSWLTLHARLKNL